jgi:hypothetical protein
LHQTLFSVKTYYTKFQSTDILFEIGQLSDSQAAVERRERLRKLALETIDISKDPYFMRNHLGSYECKLCLTLHNNEGKRKISIDNSPPVYEVYYSPLFFVLNSSDLLYNRKHLTEIMYCEALVFSL